MYRYEVYIPREGNDGQPFPDELYSTTEEEILNRFGGLSVFPEPFRGVWKDGDTGAVLTDNCIRYTVDVWNLEDNWFSQFAAVLRERFSQFSVWICRSQHSNLDERRGAFV